MSTDHHLTDRLSEYLDAELDAATRTSVDQHLAGCATCRGTLAQLRAVATDAASLTDREPATDLWAGIAARIAPVPPARVSLFRRLVTSRRISFTLPQLAAASLTLMVLSGGLVWMARSGDPRADFPSVGAVDPRAVETAPVTLANFADKHYDQAIADLEQTLAVGRTKLDPETVLVLEENLRAIDRAIDQCRRALSGDPANVYLNGHLADARQRKLTLLRKANALATMGS